MDRVEIRVAKMTLEDTASSYCESFPTTPVQTLAAKIDDLSLQEETPKKTQVTPQRTSETENISLQKETSAAAQVTPQKTTTPQQVKEVSPASSKPFTPRRLSSAAPGTPNAKRTRPKKLPIQSPDDYVQDEKVNAYVRPILNEAVSSLAAQSVQKFSAWAARSESAFDVVKIAEGSYGEVFKLRLRDDAEPRRAKLRAYGEGVFKVVPLRAQQGAGSKKFTRIDEIVAEVKLLKLMDPIPGFARFREVHVVQGRFPESFQRAWIVYKQTKDDCMNPNPANKRAYADNQLWAILEMDDAGIELEKFRWSNMFQVYDIFWGVAMALARAEELALFEVCSHCEFFINRSNSSSTGISIWATFACAQPAPTAHLTPSTRHVWIPPAASGSAALKLQSSTTLYRAQSSASAMKALLSNAARLLPPTSTASSYLTPLGGTRMRSYYETHIDSASLLSIIIIQPSLINIKLLACGMRSTRGTLSQHPLKAKRNPASGANTPPRPISSGCSSSSRIYSKTSIGQRRRRQRGAH